MFAKMYVAALALASVVLGATIDVAVGANGLRYEPDNVKAQVGDTVNFSFKTGNHTVTQSTFAAPCVKAGLASGFRPAADPALNTFSIMVNSTDPLWLFCSQDQHCQSGMVMAINAADTGDKTLAAYRALAMGGSAASGSSSGSGGPAATSSPSNASGAASGATSSVGGAASANATSLAGASGSTTASTTSTRASSTNGAGQIEPSVWGPIGLMLLPLAGLL